VIGPEQGFTCRAPHRLRRQHLTHGAFGARRIIGTSEVGARAGTQNDPEKSQKHARVVDGNCRRRHRKDIICINRRIGTAAAPAMLEYAGEAIRALSMKAA